MFDDTTSAEMARSGGVVFDKACADLDTGTRAEVVQGANACNHAGQCRGNLDVGRVGKARLATNSKGVNGSVEGALNLTDRA